MPEPTYSDPKGRLATSGGAAGALPGWQYPIADPGAATRNKLREMGMMGSPFNRSGQRMVDQLAAQAYAQFLIEASQGMSPQGDLQSEFGNFLGQLMSGEKAPMGYGQAMQGMESLRGNLSGVAQKVSGGAAAMGKDMGNPDAMKEVMMDMGLKGQLGPLEMAVAGLLSDPARQSQVFQGAFLPSLGPGLTSGLAKSMAPMEQAYSDILEALLFQSPETNYSSLLDLLLGGVAGAPQRQTPMGGMPSSPFPMGGVMGGMKPQSGYGTPPPGF